MPGISFKTGQGEEERWKIETVDLKYKEYIDALISYDKRADEVLLSSVGLDSSISSVSKDGVISKSALANLTLGKQLIFDVISRRKSDIDNYYTAMDTIIQLLEEPEEVPQQWKDSKYHKMLESLRIKSTEQFDSLYPIDLSYLFFFRTTSIQKEALEEGLSSYYDRVESREDILAILDRCLAKQTISIALRRFDVLEFPSTIRNLFDDSKVILLKYFAKYPQKTGVLSMFANGESTMTGYTDLIDHIKNLPTPLIPDIESYVFGQSHDSVKKRVDTITGTYLFVDFGEFSSQRDARNSILDTQKLAITIATKISDTADMVEEAIASNTTLHILSKLRRHLISDAEAQVVSWMETMSANHDIIPFVSPEFKSIGWTIMLDISASDVFGMKPLIQSFQED